MKAGRLWAKRSSQDSNLVDSSIPCQPPDPKIVGPLHECQTSVLVQGQAAPGGEIELWSHQRGRIGIGLEVRLKVQ